MQQSFEKESIEIDEEEEYEKRKSEKLLGETICDWLLVGFIGSGGYGNVFKCQNIRDPTTMGALKLFRHEESAKMEAEVLERLQSNDSIVKIYDHGYSIHGYYIVMELLGKNLDEFRLGLPTKTFSPETALRILLKMIKIIQSIHNNGIIHKDIKPANFIVKNREDIILIDFGISELCQRDLYRKNTPRSFKGTLLYCSTSTQLKNTHHKSDDLISAFYIYFENVLGKLPWENSTSFNEIIDLKMKFKQSGLYEKKEIPLNIISQYQMLEKLENKPVPYDQLIYKISQIFVTKNISLSPIFTETEKQILPTEENYALFRSSTSVKSDKQEM